MRVAHWAICERELCGHRFALRNARGRRRLKLEDIALGAEVAAPTDANGPDVREVQRSFGLILAKACSGKTIQRQHTCERTRRTQAHAGFEEVFATARVGHDDQNHGGRVLILWDREVDG